MKKNTDINEWRKNGGTVTYGKTKRAKGSEETLYYSLPPNIKAITKRKVIIPAHFGRSTPEWLLPQRPEVTEPTIEGTNGPT